MRNLIVKVFRITYYVSGGKSFSLAFALVYITLLNLVVLYGLSLLLHSMLPTSYIHQLFIFPYYFATMLTMLAITAICALPLPKAYKFKKKKLYDTHVLIYTIISLILLLYCRYC